MTTDTLHHDHHHDDAGSKVTFGFWVYIMTDFIMFAALFATYIVLHSNTYGSIGIAQIANLPFELTLTLILLLSSLTYGFGFSGLHKGSSCKLTFWLLITMLLGFIFIVFDLHHLTRLVHAGYTWQTSAFLSSYFTMMIVFGLHLIIAMVWLFILLVQLGIQGLTGTMKTRFTCLSLFWNYLSLVWLFIFTIVYLMGAI